MPKCSFVWIAFFCFFGLFAQETKPTYAHKKIAFSKDTIHIENKSINNAFFKIFDPSGKPIDTTFYKVDFQKGTLVFKPNSFYLDSLSVSYLKYPDFLTKSYSIYDKARIVPNEAGNLYAINQKPYQTFKPFEGLNTSGSITRGITIGNNQNAVVNSNLDLQITGKLSEKVSLRASIQDSNIPLQDSGYSQKLDEFDQIFIELFSNQWSIRAGDLFLENRQSKFLNFNKKVQGLSSRFTFGTPTKKTEIFASGALVRGQYAKSNFTGQEGNQGPYKLRGNNGELYVLVISGSERVYVNGILLQRGENNDYTIDYNAGEITFTSLFPINSEMRITIEYQYSDRNFTRLVSYAGINHEASKWSLAGYLYTENDVKNQPLQQNLSQEQVEVLKNAGDNTSLMTAPSAYIDTYSENKILYKKTTIGAVEIFEYSNNPNDELYNVRFLSVGKNQGNYTLLSGNAVGKIYQYIAPVAGILQGEYEPITRLIAPTKIQLATVLGKFTPSEKSLIDFELGISNNDNNLYSALDDTNNKGLAGKFNAKQRLLSKKITLDAFANFQWIQSNFKTIERLFNIEFNRDWNLTNPTGNQSLLVSGLDCQFGTQGFAKYQLEKLDFSDSFSGIRQVVNTRINTKNWHFKSTSSALKSEGNYAKSQFIRSENNAKYHFKKNWVGGSFRLEDNQERLVATQELSALSQKFSEWGQFIGRGDSTKVYVETGYLFRKNDSLQNGFLQRVNTSNSYYLKTQLLKNEKQNLSLFVTYRNLKYLTQKNEPSLNSRVLYNDRFFNQFIQLATVYETHSGSIAQQEFTYLEVEPGRGVYMWNDYNQNNVQELLEFEVAPFPDQAKYVRIFLPNQIFIKTHQNKFSQSVTINPSVWQNQKGFLKFLSHFYNQTAYTIDRKIIRNNARFDLNPFAASSDDLLGLNASFRNSLFLNRGKQNHSITYSFLSNRAQNLLATGFLENKTQSHQVQYLHLFKKSWLIDSSARSVLSQTLSENFPARNFEITGYQLLQKMGYLFSKSTSWEIFYEYQKKHNQMGLLEQLVQNRLGTSFTYSGKKQFTANGEFSFYNNAFTGNALSAVGFQMLEGLQPGKNQTWRLLVQKNLTQYLDININYQGRKSETSQTIHTGNIQLRAFF